MLKFIKYHMSSIEGVDVYGIAALIIFGLIFLLVTYYAFFGMTKDYADEMKSMPLQDDEPSDT